MPSRVCRATVVNAGVAMVLRAESLWSASRHVGSACPILIFSCVLALIISFRCLPNRGCGPTGENDGAHMLLGVDTM